MAWGEGGDVRVDYEGRSIKKFVPCKSWNDFDEANENGHRIDDFEEV